MARSRVHDLFVWGDH